jgi:hypothetical protein
LLSTSDAETVREVASVERERTVRDLRLDVAETVRQHSLPQVRQHSLPQVRQAALLHRVLVLWRQKRFES